MHRFCVGLHIKERQNMANKQKILIVDDDENIAELISLYMTKLTLLRSRFMTNLTIKLSTRRLFTLWV